MPWPWMSAKSADGLLARRYPSRLRHGWNRQATGTKIIRRRAKYLLTRPHIADYKNAWRGDGPSRKRGITQMTPILITAQHYLNDEIVAEKIANDDFGVTISPTFEISGVLYAVVLDGNHSHAAAIQAGKRPLVCEASAQDDDRVALLDGGDVETFLGACHMAEGDYINAATRAYVW